MLNSAVADAPPIRNTRHILTLTEYETISLPANALTAAQAARIWRDLSKQLTLEEPSIRNGQQWGITAQGWVGFLPMTPRLGLALQPKVPLHNLFRMLEVSWQLPTLRWGATHFGVRTLPTSTNGWPSCWPTKCRIVYGAGCIRPIYPTANGCPICAGGWRWRPRCASPGQPVCHAALASRRRM